MLGLGMAVRNGFRNLGIGTEIMKTLVRQAQGMGLKVLTLSTFVTNERAIHVYEKKKLGFYRLEIFRKSFSKTVNT